MVHEIQNIDEQQHWNVRPQTLGLGCSHGVAFMRSSVG